MEEDRYTRITLRIPKDVHTNLQASADARSHSMNAEIVSRLEASFTQAEEPEVDWQLRVAIRENEVRSDTLRGHAYTVRMHAELLEIRAQNLRKEGAKQEVLDEMVKNLANAKRDISDLDAQLATLKDESRRLSEQYDTASRAVNKHLDAVVDKALQPDYRRFHATENAMNLPQDMRQITTQPRVTEVKAEPVSEATSSTARSAVKRTRGKPQK